MRYNLPLARKSTRTDGVVDGPILFVSFSMSFYHRLIPWCLVILFLAFAFYTRKVVMTLISPAHAARSVPVVLATRP